MASRCLVVSVVWTVVLPVSELRADQDECDPQSGMGWTMTRLDMDVHINAADSTMMVEGAVELRLDCAESYGPTLAVNTEKPAMQWERVQSDPNAKAECGCGESFSV